MYDKMIMETTTLICGKCNTKQEMTKKFYGKKKNEFSWYCPNCNDLISQSAVKEVQDKTQPTKECKR